MRRRHWVLLALALGGTPVATAAPAAWANPCPGATACPYAAAQAVGAPAEALRVPEAVAVDAAGDVYVGDQLSYRVDKFNSAGQLVAYWGSYGSGPGEFGPIGGIATDAAGDVYVVDSGHDRVEKFGPNGEYITSWGHPGRGLGEFRFFSSPNPGDPPGGGIAVVGEHVFVSDTENDRIERFNLEGGEAMAWGSGGAGPGQLDYPRGLAGNANELLVADDLNNRIEKFSLNGEYEGAVGALGTGLGQFHNPFDVALDSAGEVFVADDRNNRIVKLNPELTPAATWGSFGGGPGQLEYPRAVASDAVGDTYVADAANGRIDVFNPAGVYLRSIGLPGNAVGVLTTPQGVAVTPAGDLLVADSGNHRIETFAPGSYAYSESWSGAGAGFGGFATPIGIGVGASGELFVADPVEHLVAGLYRENGALLAELGKGPPALQEPVAVALAPATGNVYVADVGANHVFVYSPAGALLAEWGSPTPGAAGSGPGEFNDPRAIATDSRGDVYVADYGNNRIEEFNETGAFQGQWGTAGGAAGQFQGPSGIAVGGDGDVYVTDEGNDRVEVFDAHGQFLEQWGSAGGGPGQFAQPAAIAIGCEGAVYVADTDNNRVERFQSAAVAPGDCLPAPTRPAPASAPTVNVSFEQTGSVLRGRALSIEVSCKQACRVTVAATLSVRYSSRKEGGPTRATLGGTRARRDARAQRHLRSERSVARYGRHAVRLAGVARRLPAGRAVRLRMPLTHRAVTHLRKAVRRGGVLTATVAIVATGPTGRRTTVFRTYVLTP